MRELFLHYLQHISNILKILMIVYVKKHLFVFLCNVFRKYDVCRSLFSAKQVSKYQFFKTALSCDHSADLQKKKHIFLFSTF